ATSTSVRKSKLRDGASVKQRASSIIDAPADSMENPSRFFASSRLGGDVKSSGTIFGIFSLLIPVSYFGPTVLTVAASKKWTYHQGGEHESSGAARHPPGGCHKGIHDR